MPARARRLEEDEGAEDVGLDELARRLDRAVDVGLGGEVDEGVAALDRLGDDVGVRDVAHDELAALQPSRFSLRPAYVSLSSTRISSPGFAASRRRT